MKKVFVMAIALTRAGCAGKSAIKPVDQKADTAISVYMPSLIAPIVACREDLEDSGECVEWTPYRDNVQNTAFVCNDTTCYQFLYYGPAYAKYNPKAYLGKSKIAEVTPGYKIKFLDCKMAGDALQ